MVGGFFETRETGKAREQGWAKGQDTRVTRHEGLCLAAGRPFAVARQPMRQFQPPQRHCFCTAIGARPALSALSGLRCPRKEDDETKGAAREPSLHTLHTNLTCSSLCCALQLAGRTPNLDRGAVVLLAERWVCLYRPIPTPGLL